MADNPYVRYCWVRYPPKWLEEEALPEIEAQHILRNLKLIVTEEDLPTDDLLDLLATRSLDANPAGPVEMVNALAVYHRQRVYPSERVMDWLVQGFKDWCDSAGHKSLEQCLGLKGPAGATANRLKEYYRRRMVNLMLENMLRLHCGCGVKIKDAAAMVADYLEQPGWNNTGFDFRPLSEDTLLAYWNDASWVKDQHLRDTYTRAYQDDDRKRALLEQFPPHSWQHLPELKKYR